MPELEPPGGAVFSLSRGVVVVEEVELELDVDLDDDDEESEDVIEIPGGEAYKVSTPLKTWHWKME